MIEVTRCEWAGTEPLMVAYHDDEWGVPTHDDRALFELLVLEGVQAGLSWRTVLARRACLVTALLWFAFRVGAEPAYVIEWLPGTLLMGLGIGLTFPVLSAAAVSTLPHERFGVGSADLPALASGAGVATSHAAGSMGWGFGNCAWVCGVERFGGGSGVAGVVGFTAAGFAAGVFARAAHPANASVALTARIPKLIRIEAGMLTLQSAD